MSRSSHKPKPTATAAAPRRDERGYTLVALLALMTILVLVAMSAAPSLRQQVQREREKEAIARGEEVAEAIARYTVLKGAPPTELQQLLDGITPPGSIKKIQLLRPSAARDPLSKSGEWKVVHPGDKVLAEFQDRVVKYANVPSVAALPPSTYRVFDQFRAAVGGLSNINKDRDKDLFDEPECGEDSEPNTAGGPIIGVVSRNRCAAVLTFYGIERHDLWVFTPLFR
ncbi:MAG TPA: type II secretion system protein [Pyrinomonadaceae bacterium]|jgi:type II secretory pathway pseudopilin PulG